MDIAVLVHCRHLGHKDVGGLAGLDSLGIQVLVHREMVVQPAPPGPHRPLVEEEGVVPELPRQAGVAGDGVGIPGDGVPAVHPLVQPGGDGVQVLQEHLGLAAVGGPGQAVPVLDEVQGLLDGGQPGLVEGLGVLVVVVSPEVMLMPAIHAFPSPSRSRTFM